MKVNYLLLLLILLGISCSETQKVDDMQDSEKVTQSDSVSDSIQNNSVEIALKDTCELEKRLIASGLVDIQTIIPDLLIDLRYSTLNNFMHTDVYGELEKVYLQPEVADKLKLVQDYLKEKDSSLTLLIFDGVRPRSVQQIMWDTVDIPLYRRGKFVSNPKNGSLHNYGAAVDISLAKNTGEELDMGTPYDDTSTLAYPEREAYFLKTGELTAEQFTNRQLLREVMRKGGFWHIQTEWWHFNAMNREQAKGKYVIIE